MKRRDFVNLSSMILGYSFLPKKAAYAKTPDKEKGNLSNHVIIITGGTSGMGENATRVLSKAGAKVVFCGRRENLGQKIQQELSALGLEVTYVKCDVRIEKEVQNLIQTAINKYKKIDSIFINAGIAQYPSPFHEISTDQLKNVIETNLYGSFFTAKAILPHFIKNKSGQIIFNSSYGANKVVPGAAIYAASKISLNSFVHHIAVEHAKDNIKAYSIEPLAVKTSMLEKRAKFLKKPIDLIGNNLLERVIEPKEISDFLRMLLLLNAPILSGSHFDLSAGVSHIHPGMQKG